MRYSQTTARQLQTTIQRKPIWFTEEVLGEDPWRKQKDILRAIRDYKRVAVRSGNGAGKTFTAATVVLCFLYGFPNSIVVTTAPTWRQVEKQIWKEIRRAYGQAKYPLGGALLPASPQLHILRDQWYAFGLSTSEADKFQGFHEENLLIVVDEAAGVPEAIFEGAESCLTSTNNKMLLIGNPTSLTGTFRDAFTKPGYHRIAIGAFDTPNLKAFGITSADIENDTWEEKVTSDYPKPKLVTPEWVRKRYETWGPDSVLYQARVLGEFPEQTDDTVVPLAWIEAAMERWEDTPEGKPIVLGVDVARYGSDDSVIAVRHGVKVGKLKVLHHRDTMEIAGRVKQHTCEAANIDEIGLGSGVVDRLEELEYPAVGVNVASNPRDKERFSNLRAELYWNLRDLLNPDQEDPVALPPDDDLLMELSSVKYKIDSRGRTKLEAKEDMKKRIRRSPDRADAVVLAFVPVARQPANWDRAIAALRGGRVW